MSELIWYPERGYGKIEVTGFPYDDAYFDKYARYAETARGVAITNARVAFVDKYWPHVLLDVGVGSGAFVAARESLHPETFGYDVCEKAKEWLRERDLFCDDALPALSFWDSLEHMEDPSLWLDGAGVSWVFASLPIFSGPDHALRSKHLRRDEHWWYFSESGFVRYMEEFGFSLVEKNRMEEAHGREDIGTYAFHR